MASLIQHWPQAPSNKRTYIKSQAEITRDLDSLYTADEAAHKSTRRFAQRKYLAAVYRLYWTWNRIDDAGRLTRRAAILCKHEIKSDPHPFRILIDLTTSEPDLKLRSRWQRALRFVESQHIEPDKLLKFLRRHGGVSGCARQAAYQFPSQVRPLPHALVKDWYAS